MDIKINIYYEMIIISKGLKYLYVSKFTVAAAG